MGLDHSYGDGASVGVYYKTRRGWVATDGSHWSAWASDTAIGEVA